MVEQSKERLHKEMLKSPLTKKIVLKAKAKELPKINEQIKKLKEEKKKVLKQLAVIQDIKAKWLKCEK